jgi:PST family polysaccharide transporter
MKFREVYLRLCASIGIITFPLLFGLAGLAKPLVVVTLGHKWIPIIPLVIIFSPIGIFQSIGTTVGNIYLAKGKTDLMLLWGCATGSLYILSFVVGLKWGMIGVAVAYGIVTLIVLYPSLLIPFRLINLPVSYLGQVLWRPLMASLLMLMVILGLKSTLLANLENGLLLTILIPAGGMAYLAASWIVNRLQLREVITLLFEK